MSGTLAIDLGGTKLLCALVEGGEVAARRVAPTDRADGPEGWIDAAAGAAAKWCGRFDRVGIAVTGGVRDGLWSALNPVTLGVPDDTPLVALAEAAFGLPVTAANDAQAAAWGEYRHGAGQGRDLVFLTISTGVGAGIVADGRLLTGRGGLAGHAGQMRGPDGTAPLEDRVSGRWLAAEARAAGHDLDARGVFEAAERGEGWAADLRDTLVRRAASLCADLQMLFDPEIIVIGGGIGLAAGVIERLRAALEPLPEPIRPALVRSALGENAGVVGIAALARTDADDRTRAPSMTQQETQP